MKNRILFFFLFIQCSFSKAQIAIQANQVFTPGARFEVSNEFFTFSEIDTGLAGPNQVYNLSGLMPSNLDTLAFVTPAEARFGQRLPGDRVQLRNNGQTDSRYISLNNNQLISHGHVGSTGTTSLPYIPGEVLAKFPMTYGQTHSGTFVAPIKFKVGTSILTPFVVDSIRRKQTVRYSWKVDGQGVLNCPAGTFPVLRQRVFKANSDTADFKRADNQIWLNAYETSYVEEVLFYYWSPEFLFPLVLLRDIGNGGFINDVEFVTQNLVTSVRVPEVADEVQLFPNPNGGRFRLLVPTAIKSQMPFVVFNAQGRKITEGMVNAGEPAQNIELPEAGKGLHFLRLGQKNIPFMVQ